MRRITTDGALIAAASSAHCGPTTLPPTSPRSGSNAGPSSAASSTSTSGPHRSPGQNRWPSSETPQAWRMAGQLTGSQRLVSGNQPLRPRRVPGRIGKRWCRYQRGCTLLSGSWAGEGAEYRGGVSSADPLEYPCVCRSSTLAGVVWLRPRRDGPGTVLLPGPGSTTRFQQRHRRVIQDCRLPLGSVTGHDRAAFAGRGLIRLST
jgi:hypothetical protein